VLDHGFAGGFVDSPWRSSGGAGGSSRCLGLRRGGFVVLFTATGESYGNGQQTGGGQRHSNHYWFSCIVWLDQGVDRAPWHAKPQHHAKDLHLL